MYPKDMARLPSDQTARIKYLEKELQIEASLDLVRNRGLAMDSSDQVTEVVSVINDQMRKLGLPSKSCYLYVVNEQTIDLWLSTLIKGKAQLSELTVDWKEVPALVSNHNRWKRGDKNAVYDFRGKEVEQWYDQLHKFSNGLFSKPDKLPDYQQNMEVFSRFGGIGIVNLDPLDLDEWLPVLTRFGNIFEQVFTRFQDLQKAEDLTKEAQIETALERIRSAALGMHHSTDLIQTVNAILQQITTLGVGIHSIHIYEFINRLEDYNIWASAPGQQYAMKLKCPPFHHPIFNRWQLAFDNQEDFFSIQLDKKEKIDSSSISLKIHCMTFRMSGSKLF